MSTATANPPAQVPLTRLADHRRQRLEELLRDVNVLPTSFAVPMRVLRLQRTPGAGMAQLADVIAADAGLALKVLSLANSAAFSPATAADGEDVPGLLALEGPRASLSLPAGDAPQAPTLVLRATLRSRLDAIRVCLSGRARPPNSHRRQPLLQTAEHLQAAFADASPANCLISRFQLVFQQPLMG